VATSRASFRTLGLQRLLTEKPLQLADLFLLGAKGGSRNHLFLRLRRRQRALLGQPTPCEELAGRNTAPSRRNVRDDYNYL
jgi:hypothetical protein